jgi:hydrogenase nickel incorporation protein HypB
MCTTCGCSSGARPLITNLETGESVPLHAHSHSHSHDHDHDHDHDHHHDHGHDHDHSHDHHHHSHSHSHSHEHSPSHSHEPSLSRARIISLERDLLAKNDKLAERNRGWFAGRNILALNLMSSPGAGKTTLLERTLRDMQGELVLSVIEGDQETSNDAERIRATGCKVVQINTGTGCHLEAEMLARGLELLAPPLGSVLMIENVGNLVCPALFDLGEHCKVVIMSVTEGEDKPLKYPHMFRSSRLMLLNKIDLLPHVRFDVQRCIEAAQRVNPELEIIQVSADSGEGMPSFYTWLKTQRSARAAL